MSDSQSGDSETGDRPIHDSERCDDVAERAVDNSIVHYMALPNVRVSCKRVLVM